MTTGEEVKDAQSQDGTIKVWYDNPKDPALMHIELPIKNFAENELGTALCKGILDDCKEIALKLMHEHRKKMMKESLILTAVPVVPGLKVH